MPSSLKEQDNYTYVVSQKHSGPLSYVPGTWILKPLECTLFSVVLKRIIESLTSFRMQLVPDTTNTEISNSAPEHPGRAKGLLMVSNHLTADDLIGHTYIRRAP